MTELAYRHKVVPLPDRWPQDNLRVPDGGGWMPTVNTYNAQVTKREFHNFTKSIPAISYGGIANLALPTDASGDFYAMSLGVSIIDGVAFNAPLWGTIQIIDARTENDYTMGGIRLPYFQKSPNIWRRCEFLQPLIFTRNGAIVVNIVVDPRAGVAPHNYRIDLCFDGWTEYQYASR